MASSEHHTHSSSHHSHHHRRSSHSRRRRKEARRMAWRVGTGMFFLCLLLLFMVCGMRNIYILSRGIVLVMILVAVICVLGGISTYFMIRRKQKQSDA